MIPFPLEYYKKSKPPWQVGLERIFQLLLFLFLFALTLWAAGALYHDLPNPHWRIPAASIYGFTLFFLFIFVKHRLRSTLLILLGFILVLFWWLTLKPSNHRLWQADVDRTAWAEIKDDRVTLHNVRNFDYRSETDFTPHWETRTYNLSQLQGADLFISYWGLNFMAHPILSFDFSGNSRLCFSIETRKELGETYSAMGGIYRQYELIYLAGDERDLIKLRTHFRKGEEVYLYHLRILPEALRANFLDYLKRINELHQQPEFYNAITSNCTTNIRTQSLKPGPWDWRILLNGYADKMIFERGDFTGNLPFNELKRRALIQPIPQEKDPTSNFSEYIRTGRPGF